MNTLTKFLETKSITATAEYFNITTDGTTLKVFNDLELIDPKRTIKRNLRHIRRLRFFVRKLMSEYQTVELIKKASQIKKWVIVKYPESAAYITKYPEDIKFVSDEESIMTIIVPENLYNG